MSQCQSLVPSNYSVLIQVRHTDKTIADRYLSRHFLEKVKV